MRLANNAIQFTSLLGVLILGTPLVAEARNALVVVPPGSYTLAAAIQEAEPGGIVLLKGGIHREKETALITKPIHLLGEPGAVIASEIPVAKPNALGGAVPIRPAVHIRNVRGAAVHGITFTPAPNLQTASTAIVVEGSPFTEISDNTITRFQFSIMVNCITEPNPAGGRTCVHDSDHTEIRHNQVTGQNLWTINPGDLNSIFEYGILSTNGRDVRIDNNVVSHVFLGIWANDTNGRASGNTVANTLVGIILCHVYDDWFSISGVAFGAVTPAAQWQVHDNTLINNSWGIIAIDGAHENHIINNSFSGNQMYDVELAGPTDRFKPFVSYTLPTSYDNFVVAGSQKGFSVKDCGTNDHISGSVHLINTKADACF